MLWPAVLTRGIGSQLAALPLIEAGTIQRKQLLYEFANRDKVRGG